MSLLKYWVWLSACRNVRPITIQKLLDTFETPEQIYFARENEYRTLDYLKPAEQESLMNKYLGTARTIMDECRERNYRILTMRDAEYPERLRNIYDPPVVLYVAGKLPAVDDEAAVAFVGTRKCTPYGIRAAEQIGYEYVRAGGLVVSGLARGIDSAAARGALRAGGRVIGVLGCGLNTVYPPENRALFQDVIDTGAIVSEFPPDAPVTGWNFPRRNRILSGLSVGVAVIEAPKSSGALITADHALEQGREIFAVPGNFDAEASEGSNNLLKEGAIFITSGWDIAENYRALYPHRLGTAEEKAVVRLDERETGKLVARELGTDKKEPIPAKKVIDKFKSEEYIDLVMKDEDLSPDERAVVQVLAAGELQADEIVNQTNLPANRVLSALTLLEIKNIILRKDGKRFELNLSIK